MVAEASFPTTNDNKNDNFSSFSQHCGLWIKLKIWQNRTAGPLTGSIPILGGSSADKLSGPPPSRKVSHFLMQWIVKETFCRSLNRAEFKWWPMKRESTQARWGLKPRGPSLNKMLPRCLAIWTFQCLLQDLIPPCHLQQAQLLPTEVITYMSYF